MEVTLHIGAHRTGSTRLQGALRRSQPVLAQSGVIFAGPPRLRPAHGGVMQLAAAGVPMLRPAAVRRVEEVLREARAADASRVILSDEDFAGVIDTMLRGGVLYGQIGARLGVLAESLRDMRVRICFSVRNYADFFRSLYAHRTLRRPLRPFDTYAEGFAALPRRWPDVIADIRAALPAAELTVWPYEDLKGRIGTAVSLISGVPGLPDPLSARPPALPTPTAPAIAALNARPRARGDKQARAALAAGFPAGVHPPFEPWPAAEMARLTALYDEDLQRLADGGLARLVRLAEVA